MNIYRNVKIQSGVFDKYPWFKPVDLNQYSQPYHYVTLSRKTVISNYCRYISISYITTYVPIGYKHTET